MAKKAKKSDFDELLFHGIAHRGLHDQEKTENGMFAFQNAVEHGFAFELDVHITKDNELVVIHDSELERVTGKKGIVEHLTLKELKEDYRLLDGEIIPTMQEVLSMCGERVPIVVELKTYEKNYKALAKKAMEVLSQVKDKKKITIISFDPRALLYSDKRMFTRGLLVCKESLWVLKLRGFFEYLDLDTQILEDPRVAKYRKKGGIVNTWTVTNNETFERVRGLVDQVTFQEMDHKVISDYYKA